MDQNMIPLQEIQQDIPSRAQKRPRRAGNGLLKAAIGLSAAALTVSLAALWLAWPKETPEPVSEPEAAAEVFSPVEYITYRDHQIPIDDSLPVNEWNVQAFAPAEGGRIAYEGAVHGIDVSAHQQEIDWKQVAASGVEFAMLRMGYRGYGEEGKLMEDEFFQKNLEGALEAGLEVGVYFFSQATSVWEAEEEAQMLLEALDGQALTYPVVFDWERIYNAPARTDELSGKSATLMAQAFCARVEQAGYIPGVYFNQDLGYLDLELGQLDHCVFWLAEYDNTPGFYYHFDMWQYSCTGAVPGIEGNVDLNLSFRDFAAEAAARAAEEAAQSAT